MIWFVGRDGGAVETRTGGWSIRYVAPSLPKPAKKQDVDGQGRGGRRGHGGGGDDDVDLEERGAELKALTVPGSRRSAVPGLLVGGRKPICWMDRRA